MERNKSSNSDYFVCRKVRKALASFPAFRAINNRFSQRGQEPKTVAIFPKSPSSSPPAVRTIDIDIQIKPTNPPQPPKVNTQDSEEIPIVVIDKLNLNERFTEYILETRHKIGSVSNAAGRVPVEPVPDGKADNSSEKEDNLGEHCSKFIHVGRNKFRRG